MASSSASRRVAPDDLVADVASILAAVGVPASDATIVADSLVMAERWGHPSHGVLRLSWYVKRIRAGVVSPVTRPEVLIDRGAMSLIDGRDGLGQVITVHAANDAVRRAQEHGVSVVGVRNSNHFGTAGYYTRLMAKRGCVGILTTNSSPAMAPWGGRTKAIGNNPWSVAAPAGRYGTVVVDMANTQVARGKIYNARQRGLPIPEGWAIDEEGNPTTDPVRAIGGVLAPMGGHKGYAISMAMDILSGVLTGSSFAPNVVGPYVPDRRSGAGHLVMALDVRAFLDEHDFEARIEQLIQNMKAVPLAPGFDEIFYPGELEDRSSRRADEVGVELPPKTVEELSVLADLLAVPLRIL